MANYSVYANAVFETDEDLDDLADALTGIMTSRNRPSPNHFSVGIAKVSEEVGDHPAFIDETWHDDKTMMKVFNTLTMSVSHETAQDLITELQNAGILFRERVPE